MSESEGSEVPLHAVGGKMLDSLLKHATALRARRDAGAIDQEEAQRKMALTRDAFKALQALLNCEDVMLQDGGAT